VILGVSAEAIRTNERGEGDQYERSYPSLS